MITSDSTEENEVSETVQPDDSRGLGIFIMLLMAGIWLLVLGAHL